MGARFTDAREKAWENIPNYRLAKGFEAARQAHKDLEFIKLAGNENRLGFSPRVREAVLAALDDAIYYPEPGADALGEKLAAKLGVAPEQVITGNGLFDLLTSAAHALLSPQTQAIVCDPSFPWYATASHIAGADVISVPLLDYACDLPSIAAAVTERTRVIWLCNPNNPTGAIFTNQELERLLEGLGKDVIVLLDEAYCDYVDDAAYPDSLNLLARYPNLVIARTLSKVYGLAGLRIGYLVATEELAGLLRKLTQPVRINRLSEAAALAALDDIEFANKVIANNKEGKDAWYTLLNKLDLSYVPTQTNFIFFDTGLESTAVAQQFLERGIIVRAGADFNAPTWLRVTIGSPEDNARAREVLLSIVEAGL